MTVDPLLPVSVTIVADANPVCDGTTVTFTATPTNGGAAPSYQWKVNGVNAGINSDTYAYIPVNGDIVTVDLTSNAVCATGSPATSAPVTMTVDPLLPVSVTIVADANPVCAGTTVTFTATPTNGGAAPSYQWKVNGVNAGINSDTYAYIPVNGDIVTVDLTSNAVCATGSPATSAPVTMTVDPLLPVSVTIVADANPVCDGTTVTFTATPTNGGAAPSYQWKVNGVNAGINSDTYAYIPVNGDIVTVDLTSNAVCATGSPATSAPVTMTVDPLLPVSVTIVADANPVCDGTTVTFTATPTNGGAAPSYQWKVNGVNAGINSDTYAYIPVNGDIVTVDLTSNAVCATGSPATSAPVTMTVDPLLPVSVTIVADANPVCDGTTVTFTATPTNGGAAPSYQWKVNGVNAGINSDTYAYIPVNGDIVTVDLTSNAVCATGSPATSAPVTMTVDPLLPVSVTIVADANPVCDGTTVTFTATPTNGGAAPSYQWKVNGVNAGINSDTYAYIPVNGDIVTVDLTSNAVCATGSPATSAPVTMTVDPLLPVSVTIVADANPVCDGTTVTFTATPTNGGAAPSYQWKVNGVNAGINSDTYAYIPVNGDIVTVDLTSNAVCATGSPATSAPVTMTVDPLLPVSVTIVADANPVCDGTTVTFTATPTNGGAAPAYQWKVNGVNAGINSDTYAYIPVNGDIVTVDLTSNAVCATGSPATSAPVTMTVDPLLPVSVTIVADANPVCDGTTVTFTATPTNGGAAPAYQWKVNGVNAGINSDTYAYIPVNGDIVTVDLTSNAVCATGSPATSAPVTMTVDPLLPVSVTIVADANPVCDGTTVTFTATPTNGGAAPSYQWKVNGVNAGINSDTYAYIPVNGDIVTVDLTSNAVCATGSPATSAPVTMTVDPLLPVSVTIAADANSICAGTIVTFTATSVNEGTTPNYQWNNGITPVGTNSSTYSYIPSNGDAISVILTSSEMCHSGGPVVSNIVNMIVNPVPTVTEAHTNIACFGETSGTIDITVADGTGPFTYTWTGTGVVVTSEDQSNLAAGLYSVIVSDANSCSSISLPVTIAGPVAALSGSITSQTDVTIFNGSDGSVTVTGSDGTSPYLYKLDLGAYQASGTFGSLVAGLHTITVQDINLCTFDILVTINQPSELVSGSISSQTNVSCFGTSTGIVTIEGRGGVPPYDYSIDGVTFQSSGTFGNLASGDYSVTVRDASLNTFIVSVTITQPGSSVSGSITSQTDVVCFGSSTGSVTIAGSGGTAPYDYNLGTGSYQASGTFDNLAAGSYTISVRDANLCTFDIAVNITQTATALTVSGITTSDATCFSSTNGSITVSGSGGTSPYMFSLNNGAYQVSGTFNNLGAGTYTISVMDASLCTATVPVTVSEPAIVSIVGDKVDASCPGVADGSIALTITGGTQPYSVIWSDGILSQTRQDIPAGTYSVVVADKNGCAASLDVVLTFSGTDQCIEIPDIITPNNDGYNDTWRIKNIDMFPDAEVFVFTRWGKLVFNTKNLAANPWNGTFKGRILPTDSYHYVLHLNNGSKPRSGVISIIR